MIVMSQRYIKGFLSLMRRKDYVINERPFGVNIVGVRSKSTTPNSFDDRIYVFWKNDKGNWEGRDYPVTTDPGTYYLLQPMMVDGTAILKQGQYPYQVGLHKGAYEALVQRGPVTVIRDYDRNALLDFNNGVEKTGMFGINIHRAKTVGTTDKVDDWSAGCQVFANANDFADFMALVKRSVGLYGNSSLFYTLIDERAMLRTLRRRTVYILVGIGVLGAGYFGYRYFRKK